MHLATFSNQLEVVFTKTAGSLTRLLHPNVPYVFSTNQFHKVVSTNTNIQGSLQRTSHFESRLKPFTLEPGRGNGRKVGFYAGAGGYGDQFMAWPVAKYIADNGYELHVLTDPGNNACWNFNWVKSIEQLPVPYTYLKPLDYMAFFEVVTNMDEHGDQLHPTDNLFNRIGVDYKSLPESAKTVRPTYSPEDLATAITLSGDRPTAIYQLSSSAVTRSLPATESRKLAVELARAFPQFHWLAIYDNYNHSDYFAPLTGGPANLEIRSFPKLQVCLAAISLAKLVVSCDSLCVHAAGVHDVPCVGMWGTVDPEKRALYYRKHLAVWQRQACAHSPCYHTNPENFPAKCPVMENRTTCSVVEMNSRVVVRAAKKCLQMYSSGS